MNRSICWSIRAEGSELSQRLTIERLKVGSDGKVTLTGKPGLGVHVDTGAMGAYLTPVQIQVGNEIAFEPVELWMLPCAARTYLTESNNGEEDDPEISKPLDFELCYDCLYDFYFLRG